MFKKVLVFFFIWNLPVTVLSSPSSDGSIAECDFRSWESWSICNGYCGHQKQSRERMFYCFLKPASLENCLKYCKFTNSDRLQNQSCRICENGGTVLSSSLCQCTTWYKGGCCQGMNYYIYMLWAGKITINSAYPNIFFDSLDSW